MKICYIATTVHISKSLNEALGSTTHTYAIASELSKLGHEVCVISDKFKGDLDYEKIDQLYIYRFLRGVIKSSKDIKKTKFRQFAKYFKIAPNFLLALKIAKIVQKNNCDLILERAHSLGVGALVSCLTGKPLILEVIDCIFSRLSVWRAKSIIAYTKEFFSKNNVKKIKIVNAGFDPNIFYPIKQKFKFDLCYAGSFKEWDGLEDLILAIKKVIIKKPEIKIVLIGEGVRFLEIKRLIKENKLENNIIVQGKVSLKMVNKFIAQTKICLAPFNIKRSKKGEFEKYGFYFSPLKIFEYLACGKPIIATNYPKIKEIINKENGELFKEGNSQDLADKIIMLLYERNSEEISKNNLKLARKYKWENVVKNINDLILKTIKNNIIH